MAFVGRLASMGRREAGQLIRRYGGMVLEHPDATARLVVVGEEGLPLPEFESLDDWFDEASRKAIEAGTLEVITETQLWQRLGLVDQQQDLNQLYTPAMLAELLGVQVDVIRQCHRRGLIKPAREVRRLPYFDFQEVANARRIVQLLAAKVKPREIEKKLAALSRLLPAAEHPLTNPSVVIQGKQILLRQGNDLLEPGGQLRLNFEASEEQTRQVAPAEDIAGRQIADETEDPPVAMLPFLSGGAGPDSPEAMRRLAAELEEEGQLAAAADMHRAAMAAAGPDPETCFQLAELLYRLGDLAAARERYYMAIELDEDYVEARANLGCVLAETGQRELAVAAFEGALRYHADYADVHYHLARTLDELGRRDEAEDHWHTFLDMAPDSPWAHEAQQRLASE